MSCVQIASDGVVYCHYSPPGNFIGQPATSTPPTNADCGSDGKLNIPVFQQESAATGKTLQTSTTPPANPPTKPSPQAPAPNVPATPPALVSNTPNPSSILPSYGNSGRCNALATQPLKPKASVDSSFGISVGFRLVSQQLMSLLVLFSLI